MLADYYKKEDFRMEKLLELIKKLKSEKVSDIHISPNENIYIRKNGILSCLENIKFPEDTIKKFILHTSNQKARELLGKFKQVVYSWSSHETGRLRCSVYLAKNSFNIAIRIIIDVPPTLHELGIPEPIKKVLSRQSGLIIVASPSGHGKTTTVSALINFINTHFQKQIVTVENPVEILHKEDKSLFTQRSIPLDVSNFYEGLVEAYRLYPDIVMTDSINYLDALNQAFYLCEAGCMVFAVTDGGNCQQVLERLIYSYPKESRDLLLGKIVNHLLLVICQKLVPRNDISGQIAIFDILTNTPTVKTIIKNENFQMLRSIQEHDISNGMMTFDKHLISLVQKQIINLNTALAYADNPSEIQARFPKSK